MFTFCRHRTNLPVDGRLVPFCHRLNGPFCSQQVTAENCAACAVKHPDDAKLASPDMMHRPPTLPILKTPRPDLQSIQTTLPAFVAGRDRPVHFEPDGSIIYDKDGWEPPRDIDGYTRDPQNAWRFLPLWPVCRLRLATGVRLANCGCVGVIMRCNDPRSPVFGQQAAYNQCAGCKPLERNL